MAIQIQHRRDTAANWTAANPTLASGELGFETDTRKFKMGNGATPWNSLTYGCPLLSIESLTDPDADKILFWDESENASKWLAVSTGLQISTTNLTTKDSEIVHDSLSGFVANEHIDHTTVSISPGTGMSGGGTIAATRTLDCTITQYTDALARTACIAATISDGDLTHAPDGNSVFDALALKAPLASPTFTGTATLPASTLIPDGGTIGQTAGPLLTFNDTNNYLVITGCNVGIGTTSPRVKLEIRGATTTELLLQDTGDNYAEGDTQAILGFGGRYWSGGSEPDVNAYIKSMKGSNNGNGGAQLSFWTQGRNSPTISEWMRINSDGNVGIGITAPLAKLHIDQSSTTGAKPVLTLDQADVSEEFIRFIGTAADNVIDQSIVAAADVGVATVAGYLRVYVQDDGNQITDQAYYVPIYTLAAP